MALRWLWVGGPCRTQLTERSGRVRGGPGRRADRPGAPIPQPGWGQLCPSGQLHGRPLACAITPGPDGTPAAKGPPTTSGAKVMDSDGQAFRLVKQEARCRQEGP